MIYKRTRLLFLFLLMVNQFTFAQVSKPTTIKILANETWWSGVVSKSNLMPLKANAVFQFQMLGANQGNQVQPLLLSNKGRYVWSEFPFKFTFNKGEIQLEGSTTIETGSSGSSLKEVQQYVRNKYFLTAGLMPDSLLITQPQYNTWIELNYNQNQVDVLKYAHAILDNGLPPGVIMIDDTWQENYGIWDFHPKRFSNPKAMVDELHQLGFKVMLWVCTFVSADSKEYRMLSKKNALLKDSTGKNSALINWWNGWSAVLDFSNPVATDWFKSRLNFLQQQYGVDGFKFDAGDFPYYPEGSRAAQPITANEHSRLYAAIGLDYPLNEYRACWKMGGQPLVQRLMDKEHTWKDLQSLIPGMTTSGLVGYAFNCPDMIGGGEIESFWNNEKNLDQELIVRSAQCHALMPMMQFSVAPWRVLDSVHFAAVINAVKLRQKFVPYLMQLAKNAAKFGEPIVKNMEYVFPNQGFEFINDQFMLGDSVMVAPVVQKQPSRSVKFPILPSGKWKSADGKLYKGGSTVNLAVALTEIPYFTRTK